MVDELVQYYIVNSELNMSKGKIAAQVGHVATLIAFAYLTNPQGDKIREVFKKWFYEYDQKKIVLRGKQKDLDRLINQGFWYIEDSGLNEVSPNSLTCVGLGVMWKSEAQEYIKRLQLL